MQIPNINIFRYKMNRNNKISKGENRHITVQIKEVFGTKKGLRIKYIPYCKYDKNN